MGETSARANATVERVLVHPTGRIAYRLHLRKRRGLRISVTPDLTVNVFAPQRASTAWIETAVNERSDWIVRTLRKVATCEILHLPSAPKEGAILSYLGRPYRLAVSGDGRRQVDLLFDSFLVTTSDPDNRIAVGRQVRDWYRAQARILFAESIRRCLPRLAGLGTEAPVPRVRDMRSRWGSCSSDGRITLNLKLAMLPERLIDYVVMHELCHLVHHDHSKRYYALLTKAMQDWPERKKEINRYRMK